MKLRDHPLMTYQGIRNWPPVWTGARPNAAKTLTGEVGVLTYAYCNPNLSTRCYLVMDHEGETYVGTLILDNPIFCQQLCRVLLQHLKLPVKEIGGIEWPHTT